jgi:hypothetical protein
MSSTAFRLLLLAGLLCLLSACSTLGRKEEMTGIAASMTIVNQHSGAVSVSVTGSDERLVTAAVFSESLIQTIKDTRLFSSASPAKGGPYELSVVLLSMSHPFLAFVADMSSQWTLRAADGKEIWTETIHASGRSSQFAGVARVRASYEGAARSTIEIGITKLSALKLDPR